METDVEKHMQDIARSSRYAKSPYIHIVAGATAAALIAAKKNKKLSYRQGTARCVVSIEILPIATQKCRNYLYDKS